MIVLPTTIPTTWNLSVLYGKLKNNYEIFPQPPTGTLTDWYPSVFYKELQKTYGILPLSPTAIPTDWYLSILDIELQKNYNPCHHHQCIYQQIHQRLVHIQKCTVVRPPSRSAQLPTTTANPMLLCSDTCFPMDRKIW